MINFSIGFGVGLIFSCLVLVFIMYYGKKTTALDTGKQAFENRMYEYWDTSMERWDQKLNIQQAQHETACEILFELKKMNELTEGK